MSGDPLHTKLCDMLGIEYPVIAFTHCKDVAVSVINGGGFAVLGEAMHTPEEIEADVHWIRDRVEGRPFGVDLVLPASVPPAGSVDELMANIPETHRAFAQDIKERYDVPDPKGQVDLHQWGGLNQELARAQLDVLLEERVPVIASGLGSPAFMLDAAHERGIKVFGLVGKARQAKRQLEAGVDAIIAQGYDAAGHTGNVGTLSIVAEVAAMAGDTPIIAAGGITTGRHLAAVAVPGRCRRVDRHPLAGVSRIGRRHDHQGADPRGDDGRHHLQHLDLRDDHAGASAARGPRNGPSRTLRHPLQAPYQMLLSSDYIQGANDNRRADLMTEAAGQGVSFVTSMKPAKQILFDMVEEALDTFDGICWQMADRVHERVCGVRPRDGGSASRSATAATRCSAPTSPAARSSPARSPATTSTTATRHGVGTCSVSSPSDRRSYAHDTVWCESGNLFVVGRDGPYCLRTHAPSKEGQWKHCWNVWAARRR